MTDQRDNRCSFAEAAFENFDIPGLPTGTEFLPHAPRAVVLGNELECVFFGAE